MRKFLLSLLYCIALSSPLICADAPPSTPPPTHGIAIFGDLKYPADFTHYDYTNPDAPKGGSVKLSSSSSFDNFNPFIIRGNSAPGAGLLHCSLLDHSGDEPSSMYAYLAEKVELAPDRSSVTFTLNPKAKFSDGSPVTVDDVIFSFNTLIKKGIPLFAQYYRDVKTVEKVGENQVRFVFSTLKNRELPMILGQLPVFSKAYFEKNDFEKVSLTPPVGCGPYKVAKFKAGDSVSYERIPDWWAANIPSQKGQYNFDISYANYRDQEVLFQAFKAGESDFRVETSAKNWATGYDIPAVKEGNLIKKEVPNKLPQGIQLFVFNTRRSVFEDPQVRKALTDVFNFEWTNKNLFYSSYLRNNSYFSNSPLASSGIPEGEELEILKQYKAQLPVDLFTKPFTLPVMSNPTVSRKAIVEGGKLLEKAGWVIKNGKRVSKKSGEPFTFELLLHDPSFEKIALALKRNLKPLGIDMTIRTVTPSQYMEKVSRFDYDMIFVPIPESETPGNEQRDFWGSKAADKQNGQNYAGIRNPVIDNLIELVITSPTREELTTRVHALDRVLLWGYYGIPGWYSATARFAYWNKFGQPKVKPNDGVGFTTWWIDPALEKKLDR